MKLKEMLLVAAVTLVGSACGNDATAPEVVSGTYRLERVNGNVLPFLAEQSGSFRIDILSGSLIVRADRTFTGEIVSTQTNGQSVQTLTEQTGGTYTRTGSTITFSETGSISYQGQVSATTLTAQRAGVTFTFVKE